MTPAQLTEADALWDEAKRGEAPIVREPEPVEEPAPRYWWLRD